MPISSWCSAIDSCAAYGRVERLAGAVVAGPGVVAADDEVGAAVVAADDRVQEDLARAGHPHRQRQQAQDDRAGLVVVVDQGPVAADAGEVVDVAGLGHADDRVDQQAAADLLGRALGQLLVGAVQRVAGLEGDDLGPAQRLRSASRSSAGVRRSSTKS